MLELICLSVCLVSLFLYIFLWGGIGTILQHVSANHPHLFYPEPVSVVNSVGSLVCVYVHWGAQVSNFCPPRKCIQSGVYPSIRQSNIPSESK